MGNKEEFKELYSQAMEEFKNNISYLQNVEQEIKEYSIMLKALDAIPECDEETREKLNEVYFALNGINKTLRNMRKNKEMKKEKLDPYFKVFNFSQKEYVETIIELNSLLKKYQPMIGKQIMKCFNYLNDRGIEITL